MGGRWCCTATGWRRTGEQPPSVDRRRGLQAAPLLRPQRGQPAPQDPKGRSHQERLIAPHLGLQRGLPVPWASQDQEERLLLAGEHSGRSGHAGCHGVFWTLKLRSSRPRTRERGGSVTPWLEILDCGGNVHVSCAIVLVLMCSGVL